MSEDVVNTGQETTNAQVAEPVSPVQEAQVQTEQDAKAPEVVAPEKYEFKVPEGFESLDADLLAQFETKAKSHNLSQDAAQEYVDLYASKLSDFKQQAEAERAKNIEAWEAQAKSDKEFGGEGFEANLLKAQRAASNPKLVTEELRKLFESSGLGSHPEVLRHFYRLHTQFMAEDTLHNGSPGGKQKDLAKSLFPGFN